MTVTLFYLSRLHNIRKYSFDAELFGGIRYSVLFGIRHYSFRGIRWYSVFGDIRYSVLFGIRHYSFEVFVGIRYSLVFGISLRISNIRIFGPNIRKYRIHSTTLIQTYVHSLHHGQTIFRD